MDVLLVEPELVSPVDNEPEDSSRLLKLEVTEEKAVDSGELLFS